MSSYNENLRSNVVASLNTQELDLIKAKGKKNASMFTLYYAEGATLKAQDRLLQTENVLTNKQETKTQAVANGNISNNLVDSANQASQYGKQSITNSAVCAANVQIAANSIVRLASDMGSIFGILSAADRKTDMYMLAESTLDLMNNTAIEAEFASNNAMEASIAASEVTASTVQDKAKANSDLMNTMLKIANDEFTATSQLVVSENATLSSANAVEKLAEGEFLDLVVDLKSTNQAYMATNSGLNLNLTVQVIDSGSFTIAYNPLRLPFRSVAKKAAAQRAANPYYPVKNYYFIVVKNSKKATFSISNAENILIQDISGTDHTTPSTATPRIIPFQAPVPPLTVPFISQTVNFTQMMINGQSYTINDSDNDPINLGTKYVVFVLALYTDDYKKNLNCFDDFLSAASPFFKLRKNLAAVDPGTISIRESESYASSVNATAAAALATAAAEAVATATEAVDKAIGKQKKATDAATKAAAASTAATAAAKAATDKSTAAAADAAAALDAMFADTTPATIAAANAADIAAQTAADAATAASAYATTQASAATAATDKVNTANDAVTTAKSALSDATTKYGNAKKASLAAAAAAASAAADAAAAAASANAAAATGAPPAVPFNYLLNFTVAENPANADVVEYHCIFLPQLDPSAGPMLNTEAAKSFQNEATNIERIAEKFEPQIAKAQAEAIYLENQISQYEPSGSAQGGSGTPDPEEVKLLSDYAQAKELVQSLQQQMQDLIESDTDGSATSTIGFLFNKKIAEKVLPGNYIVAQNPQPLPTVQGAPTTTVANPKKGKVNTPDPDPSSADTGTTTTDFGPKTVQWDVQITEDVTDNFGTPLIPGQMYIPVIVSYCIAQENNLPMFDNSWSGYLKSATFQYQPTLVNI